MSFGVEDLSFLYEYILADLNMLLISSFIELPSTLSALFKVAVYSIIESRSLFLLWTVGLVLESLSCSWLVDQCRRHLLINTLGFYWLKHLPEVLVLLTGLYWGWLRIMSGL